MAGDQTYDPTKIYNDHASPFLHMNKALVEDLFGVNGPYSQSEFTPNWLEKHELGYELVRVAESGEVVARLGIFISIGARPTEGVQWERGKGKAIAYWNFAVHAPSDDYSVRLFSDLKYHYIIAYENGYVGITGPRSGPKHNAQSTLLAENKDGRFPFMPFVYLAFFMWLEEDEQMNGTWKWLFDNAIGWKEAYA